MRAPKFPFRANEGRPLTATFATRQLPARASAVASSRTSPSNHPIPCAPPRPSPL